MPLFRKLDFATNFQLNARNKWGTCIRTFQPLEEWGFKYTENLLAGLNTTKTAE